MTDIGMSGSMGQRIATIEGAVLRGAVASHIVSANVAIGGQITPTVTFNKALPHTNYFPVITIEGTADLLGGNLTAMVLQNTRTTTTVQLVIKNNALLALGLNARINVLAVY